MGVRFCVSILMNLVLALTFVQAPFLHVHEHEETQRHRGEFFLVQELKVNRSIGIAVQDEALPVAALRDMVWDIHCDHSIESAHDRHDKSSYFAMLKLLPR
jgi:hypothetical protein